LVAGVDLSQLEHIAIEFGSLTTGNPQRTILFVDDIAFVKADGSTCPAPMPRVFPQHWPYSSVAGTAWLVFEELDVNPFARLPRWIGRNR
jgi:hypothetical protein